MSDTVEPRKIYQFILIGVILVIAWILWRELGFLFPSLLGAIALYILLKDPMAWLMKAKHMKNWLAAALLMVLTVVVIVVPSWFIIKLLIVKAQPLIASPEFFTETFDKINSYLADTLGINILNQDTLMKFSGKLTGFAQDILNGTFRTAMILVFMYLFLFFMMINGRKMEAFIEKTLPFSRENKDRILNEVTSMVRSNAITIPTVAFLQGTVAFLGYLVFGIQEALLLGVLTAISSMIPVIGAMLVYLPVTIYTLAIGDITSGIGVGLWCFILVGSVDNVARFLLQKRLANVHPLITILGVILGTKLFGLIGLIFGPLTITLFVVLVKIYFSEFGALTLITPRKEGQALEGRRQKAEGKRKGRRKKEKGKSEV